MALLLPFDVNARFVLNHTASPLASLPFTWTLASAALESDIDTSSLGIWANALLPDLSQASLCQPLTLLSRQKTQTSLKSLLAPLASGLAPFELAPALPAFQMPSSRTASPAPLATFEGRSLFAMPTLQPRANLSHRLYNPGPWLYNLCPWLDVRIGVKSPRPYFLNFNESLAMRMFRELNGPEIFPLAKPRFKRHPFYSASS